MKQIKQEVGDDLSACVLNLFPLVSTLPSLMAISDSEDINFSNCHVIQVRLPD